jgi:hypothetical protein
MTGSVPTYGTVGKPYPEQPYYSRTREVHWSGTFGVLTVTVLGSMTMRGGRPDYSYNSSHDLSSGAGVLVGPYGIGDAIPRTHWPGEADASVQFTDDRFFVETIGDIEGGSLGAARFCYLYDFAALAKEQATNPALPTQNGEVFISQGWSDDAIPELEAGYDYKNQYRLQIYRTDSNFVAAPDQTVTVRPGTVPTYDATRLIAWNYGGGDGIGFARNVLHFNKTGWLDAAPPVLTSVLLSEAIV